MDRKAYLLDTSAVLTLIEDERGSERVEEILRKEKVFLPFLALMEVHYISRQERGAGEADRRYALIKQLPCEILWQTDEPTLLTASRFKASYRLSLADALIAAFAQRQSAILLHKDPEFEALLEQVELEALPYKNSATS
jgi:predicted nucleic acid-binding protein